MTRNSNETRQGLTARSRVSARGGAASIVPQPSDTARAEVDETAVIRDYWQAAKARYRRGDFPDYGSDDWKALDLEDPRKMAGLVAFAQMWLRYGDEIADDLNRRLQAPQELWQRATPEACAQAFQQMAAQQQYRREAA